MLGFSAIRATHVTRHTQEGCVITNIHEELLIKNKQIAAARLSVFHFGYGFTALPRCQLVVGAGLPRGLLRGVLEQPGDCALYGVRLA